ncbi:leucine-rich repeat protein [Kineothrix sp. MSJ-39]|uniref:leucine-rich repeat protein n=1 Tax=Kineothrix sp. MSJ-39 TaxID=2841533 RepID=UPI001C11C28D|nr:leucine-rich repeat protein [Kineothrix sp. MSJ-39]MBU5429423.1 leucine-rich repeat protein [Kineothrix sp. MSJ-39]
MTEKNKNRAIGRQVRKMIAAAMAAMLVVTSANVADVNAEETVLAVSENTVTGENGARVVEAENNTENNTGEPGVENSEAENSDTEITDLDAETADAHTYENGFCTDSGCSAYEPAILTTDKYDMNGDGKMDEAYEIGNAGQLYWFAGLVNGTLTDGTAQNLKANAVLTKNIIVNEDLLTSIKTDEDGNVTNGSSFKAWQPMGILSTDGKWQMEYAGTFDGDGHSISGLYVNMVELSDERVICFGLFGFFAGVIRNLGILDSYMRGDYCIGGICGRNDGGTIQNCDSTAAVYGESYVGGICGRSRSNSIIENCYNAGQVYGTSKSVGGICGDNFSTIENSYNVGSIKGNNGVGGIVGESSGYGNIIYIKDCYNRGNVIGDTKYIGGIGGYIGYSLVENCYSQATVSGNTNVGGVCGDGREDTFHNTYYDSNLYVGDAIGYKDAALTTEKTEGKPSQAFESGEIAYLLQADREESVWGQTLSGNDVQAYPVLGSKRVYQNITYQDCTKDEAHTIYEYTNDQKPTVYEYTLQETKAKEPTCTEAGNTAYYKCNVCGKFYSDQEGTNEVSAEAVVIPAKGHSFTWIIDKEATEQAEGSRHEECSICHEKKAAVAIPKLPSNTKPGEQPSQTPGEQPGQDTKVPAKGTKLTAKDGARYQVTSAAEKNPTVAYTGSKKQSASVTIPATVTINNVTYKVTSIAANAFKNNKKLKKVVIGKNITKIGKKAFYGCSKLKNITVKTTKLTKKNVGSQAFKGIHKKAAFKVPKKKISSYRKVFKARGASKTIKVTK